MSPHITCSIILKTLILSVSLAITAIGYAQEYTVESFNVVQDDLTAKTNPKTDLNGKRCALIKVYVDDKIAAVRGNIIGDVTTIGMEKSFYLTDGSRKLELIFDNHYPLKIVFDEYNIPALTGAMTYVLKLKTNGSSIQAETSVQPQQQATQSDIQSPKQSNIPTAPYTPNSSQNEINSGIGRQNQATTFQPDSYRSSAYGGDFQTLMNDGKKAFDSYDKDLINSMVNPASVDNIKMGYDLLNGYKNYVQALTIASNQKSNKQIKNIVKTLNEHVNDYFNAGAYFFNAKKIYPEAYECFMIYADMPNQEFMRGEKLDLTDTDRGTAYFNAGLAAYSGNELIHSANAFRRAREIGYDDKQAYIYEIACWQSLVKTDPSIEETAKQKIVEVAQDGDRKFGLSEPVFYNNIINFLVVDEKYNQALADISQRIAQNPNNAGLYGLRGFVYDRMGKDDESVADYRKAAATDGVDFETLKNAAKKIFRTGTNKWDNIEGNSDADRAARADVKTNYLEVAKAITDKAKAMNSNDEDLDYVIESIDYMLSLTK